LLEKILKNYTSLPGASFGKIAQDIIIRNKFLNSNLNSNGSGGYQIKINSNEIKKFFDNLEKN